MNGSQGCGRRIRKHGWPGGCGDTWKQTNLLRELRDVLEVLVEIAVELRQLDDRGSVPPLKVLADVLAEALFSLSEAIEFLWVREG